MFSVIKVDLFEFHLELKTASLNRSKDMYIPGWKQLGDELSV